MRRLTESLNMYLLDYLIVPVWAVFSVLGNMQSGKIMVPITLVFIAVNYMSTRNSAKLFLLNINLATASIAGIILNTFLYIRFVYADPQIITNMVSLIFLYTFYITFASIICLLLKALMHRRNMRIISRMAEGAYDAEDDEEDEYYDEDEDDEDEDDVDEDEEDEDDEEGTGFLTSISNLLKSRGEQENPAEKEDEEDEEDDGYEKPDGPKFRVVKK